jgi:DsbC/DsbD-like thiol-disulfide interchange protein
MANALIDLYDMTGDEAWKEQAETLLKAFGKAINDNPRAYTHIVQALLRLNHAIPAVAIKSQPSDKAAVQNAMETKAHVVVRVTDSKREGDKLTVTALLDIAEGWHINANPASLDFLIPASVDVRNDSGTVEASPEYPDAHAMATPLGDILVYEGKANIPVTMTLAAGTQNLRLLVRAQACKDTTCLAPSDWVFPLKTQ